jgi:hypothetical protein
MRARPRAKGCRDRVRRNPDRAQLDSALPPETTYPGRCAEPRARPNVVGLLQTGSGPAGVSLSAPIGLIGIGREDGCKGVEPTA